MSLTLTASLIEPITIAGQWTCPSSVHSLGRVRVFISHTHSRNTHTHTHTHSRNTHTHTHTHTHTKNTHTHTHTLYTPTLERHIHGVGHSQLLGSSEKGEKKGRRRKKGTKMQVN